MRAPTLNYGNPINRAHPLMRGLVSRWKVLPKNGGGIYFRDIAHRNHALLTNGPLWRGSLGRQGSFGNVLFDGSNDYSTCGSATPANLQIASDISFCAWVYRTATIDAMGIAVCASGYAFGASCGWAFMGYTGEAIAVCAGSAGGPTLGPTIPVNTWCFVAASVNYAAGTIDYRVNDTATQTTGSSFSAPSYASKVVSIGSFNNTNGCLTGRLDDVMVFNGFKTPSELQRLYHATKQQYDPTLNYVRRRSRKAAAGGTAFDRSLSESLAGSDAYARLSDGKRSYSESAGAQNPYARTSVANRSNSDSMGLSDAYSRTGTWKRSESDNLAASDSFARGVVWGRPNSDSLGFTDAYQRLAAHLRSHSDNLAASNPFQRVSDAKRAESDNLGTSDAFARLVAALRAFSDSVGTSDAYQRLAAHKRSESDNLGGTDAFARVSDAKRAYADNLGLQDLATLAKIGAGVLTLAVAELLGFSNPFQRLSDANRTHSDTIGVAESVARTFTAIRAMQDVVGLADAYARTSTALRSLEDVVAMAESYQRIADANRVFTDLLGMIDDPDLRKIGVAVALLMLRRRHAAR